MAGQFWPLDADAFRKCTRPGKKLFLEIEAPARVIMRMWKTCWPFRKVTPACRPEIWCFNRGLGLARGRTATSDKNAVPSFVVRRCQVPGSECQPLETLPAAAKPYAAVRNKDEEPCLREVSPSLTGPRFFATCSHTHGRNARPPPYSSSPAREPYSCARNATQDRKRKGCLGLQALWRGHRVRKRWRPVVRLRVRHGRRSKLRPCFSAWARLAGVHR